MSTQLPYNEKELLPRIAEGDEQAFGQLFYHYGPVLHPVVLKIVKERSVAEDIVADVFLKLWLTRDSLPGITNLAGYIYRLATNLSINHLRRNKLEDTVLKQLYLDIPGRENTIEKQVSARELKQVIHKAVETLPPQRRRIYTLSREKGMNRQEIAHLLQISENTVKNQLRISLHHIRQAVLKEYGLSLCAIFFIEIF